MARILIVEDDRSFADALASTLRVEGHEVAVAVTADEGLQLGSARCPDLLIADWMLDNDLHGGEVCRRLHAACPALKPIIMTGYPDAIPKSDRWSEYTETIIEKPFHKASILEAVDRALSCPAASQAPP